jgi:hypothetical protein
LTCRETGIPASVRLELNDLEGLAFDCTVTWRLVKHDIEMREALAKQIGYEVAKATWGTKEEEETVEYP